MANYFFFKAAVRFSGCNCRDRADARLRAQCGRGNFSRRGRATRIHGAYNCAMSVPRSFIVKIDNREKMQPRGGFGNRSPRINHVAWGRLEVEGKTEPYKDAKLFPGGSCEWNWRETGTGHVPGIQVADVQELLNHGAKVVVLSRGMKKCLEVPRETLDFLKEKQIEAHVLPTAEAVELYNKLGEKSLVGGLFHTTC
jgi:hypothetical protein